MRDLFISEERQNPLVIDDNDFEMVSLSAAERADWRLLGKELKTDYSKFRRPDMGSLFRDDEEIECDGILTAVALKDRFVRSFTVLIKSFDWMDTHREPIFGCMYFLDTANNLRLSESYHFTYSQDMQSVMRRPVIFSVCNVNADLALVVRFYKEFSGDASKWLESYQKGKIKTDEKTKHDYRQPLGTYAMKLFEDVNFGDISQALPLRTIDTHWIETSLDVQNVDDQLSLPKTTGFLGSKKTKTLPFKLTLELEEVDNAINLMSHGRENHLVWCNSKWSR
jgi:hypothetical protein